MSNLVKKILTKLPKMYKVNNCQNFRKKYT